MGIEIGSSALDHDGNTDPEVEPAKPIQPGESRNIVLTLEIIQGECWELDCKKLLKHQTRLIKIQAGLISFDLLLAERVGFEPTIPFWSIHTFQACSFDHSDISPFIVCCFISQQG